MACHYRVAVRERESRAAGSAARHHPGRRRHAAPAAAVRRRAGARDVHRRQAGAGSARAERRHHRCDRRRRSAGGRDRVRACTRGGRRAPQDARAHRQDRRPGQRAWPPARPPVPRSPRPPAARARRSPPSTASKRRSRWTSRPARRASASCSPTACSRPNRRALRHLFFAEREVGKIPDVPKDTPARDIKRAAVIGAGTMGGGIAMAYANAGIPVLLKDVDQAALDRGLATIRKNYESTVSKGKMTPEAMAKTLALITPTTTLRRLRHGGHRRRGGLREHGSQEDDVRRARRR